VAAFVPGAARTSRVLLNAVSLPDLPYDYTALEPHIGKQTLEIHHDKHHAKYVSVTNEMISGTEMEGDDVTTIFMKAHAAGNQGLFNNAAQSFNHGAADLERQAAFFFLFLPPSRPLSLPSTLPPWQPSTGTA